MAGYRRAVTATLVLCLLAMALFAAPPRPRRVGILPPEPSAFVDDVLTIPPRSTPLFFSEHIIAFIGHTFPVKNSDGRTFLVRLHQHIDASVDEYWTTRYPPCKVGMLLPV